MPNSQPSTLLIGLGLSILLALAGCASTQPQAASRQSIEPRRTGEVFVFRGFMGVWSRGMDQITTRLRGDGIVTSVFGYNQWTTVAEQIVAERKRDGSRQPLVLIGHSYGADDALRLAVELQRKNTGVDLVITVECVIPPAVPANVRTEVNIYKPRALDFLPWWRGVPVRLADPRASTLEQIDIHASRPDIDRPDLGHSDIDKDPKVLDLMEQKVLEVCRPMREGGR
jgi:pimeloyl-ACP methyl ester carboxylesterase